MKKGISISMIILTLTAMIQLSVATHYCGGEIAGSKISFSGKVASCGMEDQENSLPCTETYLTTFCCQDVVHSYSITSNYFPSLSVLPETYLQSSPHFDVARRTDLHFSFSSRINSNKSPPGDIDCHSVDLSEICILRI
jgi:hypothetical protein